MPSRRPRARRRLAALVVVALVLVLAVLTAGVVRAAHRDPGYRASVDASFAAEASVLVASSDDTGVALADAVAHPGRLGRQLLAARLGELVRQSAADAEAAEGLLSPPPDAGAGTRLVDVLRLRARGVATVASTLEGLLGLTPTLPAGSAGTAPRPAPHVALPGAKHLLRLAGERFVLADRDYARLAAAFARAGRGATLPASRWITSRSKVLLPATLLALAPSIAASPALQASVHLVLAAVATTPPELPFGHGYPVLPTGGFTVSISVRNVGTAPSVVHATVTVRPIGQSHGRGDIGHATAVVGAGGAVAIVLPTMPVVPGEHCLVTVQVARPPQQLQHGGLRWRRVVVVAPVGG